MELSVSDKRNTHNVQSGGSLS